MSDQMLALSRKTLPQGVTRLLNTDTGHYLGVLFLFGAIIGSVLLLVYLQVSLDVVGRRKS